MTARAVNTPLSFFMSPQWEKRTRRRQAALQFSTNTNGGTDSGRRPMRRSLTQPGIQRPQSICSPTSGETVVSGKAQSFRKPMQRRPRRYGIRTLFGSTAPDGTTADPAHFTLPDGAGSAFAKKSAPGRSQIIRGRLFLSRKAELTSAAPRALRAAAKVRPAGVRQTSYSAL